MQVLLAGLRKHLVDPSIIKLFLKTYHAERKRIAADATNIRARRDRELTEVARKIERATVAMLASTAAIQTFTDAINWLELERRRLQEELATMAQPVSLVDLPPPAQAKYLATVDSLAVTIADRASSSETAMAVRDLIETVTVIKTDPGAPISIDVRERLARLLEAPMFPDGSMSGLEIAAGSRYQKF